MNHSMYKLAKILGEVAAKQQPAIPYTKEGISIMNIQFDLAWEEIYGWRP